MDCVIETVTLDAKNSLRTRCFSLETDVSPPACPFSSRSLLLKVKASNLKSVTDPILMRKLISTIPEVDPATPFLFSVGNCVVGSVVTVGDQVEDFEVGENVVAILPSPLTLEDSPSVGGLSQLCLVDGFHATHLPSTSLPSTSLPLSTAPPKEGRLLPTSDESIVAILPHLINAFTSLHYQSRLVAGESLLLLNAGSNFGLVLAQLASLRGVKVLAVADCHDAKYRLLHLVGADDSGDARRGHPPRVIDLSNARVRSEGAYVLKYVLDETNGIGVDCVVDISDRRCSRESGGNNNDQTATVTSTVVARRDVISCLATGGRWITDDSALQLDPPETEVLFLKGASLSFLFDHWLLCPSQVGRFHHVMREALRMIVNGDVGLDVEVLDGWDVVLKKLNERGEKKNLKATAFKLPPL